MGGADLYISRFRAPFIRITSTEVTAIDSCAAYSMASDATLVPLSQGIEVTSVTGAFHIERLLHVTLMGTISAHAML